MHNKNKEIDSWHSFRNAYAARCYPQKKEGLENSKTLHEAIDCERKKVCVLHTEYTVSAYGPGVIYERTFPDRNAALNYADAMRKQPGVRRCTIDTMMVSDCMDRFQLKKKEDDGERTVEDGR